MNKAHHSRKQTRLFPSRKGTLKKSRKPNASKWPFSVSEDVLIEWDEISRVERSPVSRSNACIFFFLTRISPVLLLLSLHGPLSRLFLFPIFFPSSFPARLSGRALRVGRRFVVALELIIFFAAFQALRPELFYMFLFFLFSYSESTVKRRVGVQRWRTWIRRRCSNGSRWVNYQ